MQIMLIYLDLIYKNVFKILLSCRFIPVYNSLTWFSASAGFSDS